MKRLLLPVTAFRGLAASEAAARATQFDFTYSGSLVNFTIATADTYQILALGAQGENGTFFRGASGAGGLGAEFGGNFGLTAGEVLRIIVGGAGSSTPVNEPFGSGGNFVVGPGK